MFRSRIPATSPTTRKRGEKPWIKEETYSQAPRIQPLPEVDYGGDIPEIETQTDIKWQQLEKMRETPSTDTAYLLLLYDASVKYV